MRQTWLPRRIVGATVLAAAALVPGLAAAAETGPRHAIEVQGLVMTQLLPHTYFGADGAYVVGNQNFQARFGVQIASGKPMSLGVGKIGNIITVATLDACGAKQVFRHRVRMCIGGQGGAMTHRWIGFPQPGRPVTPYVTGVLKGDYAISLSERFAVMFGVAVIVPVVGPEFRAEDAKGRLSPIVFPGPVAGLVTLGGAFRLR